MDSQNRDLLLRLGQALGSHAGELTLGTEGSAAVRAGADCFLVTRRGATLRELEPADAVEVKTEEARALLERDTLPEDGVRGALALPEGPEPSSDMLTYAHLFALDGVEMIAHVQPVEINQIISSPRARQFADRRTLAEEVIACGSSSVLVPYMDPGLPLAREVVRKVMLWRDRNKKTPRLVLLQNHGMIVVGESLEPVMATLEAAIKSARVFVGSAMMGGPVYLSPNNVVHLEGLTEL